MASSEEEIPGTPLKKKSHLIGGLSGKVTLPSSKKSCSPNKRKASDSADERGKSKKNLKRKASDSEESKSTEDLITEPSLGENCADSPRSKIAKFFEKEGISFQGESGSSPLRPRYSGSPQWTDAQDIFALYDSQRSSDPDSSIPSHTSFCILSPLGSRTNSETSEDSS